MAATAPGAAICVRGVYSQANRLVKMVMPSSSTPLALWASVVSEDSMAFRALPKGPSPQEPVMSSTKMIWKLRVAEVAEARTPKSL